MGPLLRTGALGRLGRHAHVDLEPFERVARLLSSGFRLVLFALFGCLVILLAREPLERVADKVGEEVWRCGLIGLLSPFLIFPLLIITIVVLAVSVIGIPLLVLIPFAILALVVGGFLGYTAVALQIGRWAERRFGWNLGSPYLAVFVGLLGLQGWTLAGRALDWDVTPLGFFSGMLLFTGFVFQMIAALIGFGAVLITRFGTYAVWRGWRLHRPETMPAWSGSGYGGPVSPAASAGCFRARRASDGGRRDAARGRFADGFRDRPRHRRFGRRNQARSLSLRTGPRWRRPRSFPGVGRPVPEWPPHDAGSRSHRCRRRNRLARIDGHCHRKVGPPCTHLRRRRRGARLPRTVRFRTPGDLRPAHARNGRHRLSRRRCASGRTTSASSW
jgi:hypothetical protein